MDIPEDQNQNKYGREKHGHQKRAPATREIPKYLIKILFLVYEAFF